MKKIIFFILLLVVALLQATLANGVRVFGVKPELFWIMVLACGLYFDLRTAVVFSLTCGLLKDCMGVSSYGIYTILFPLWALAINTLSKRISFDHMSVCASFLAVMIFVNEAIVRSIPFISSNQLSFGAFMKVGCIEGLYTALLFLWLGPRLRRIAESTLW
jgi:rod shape-determining protein MreD